MGFEPMFKDESLSPKPSTFLRVSSSLKTTTKERLSARRPGQVFSGIESC